MGNVLTEAAHARIEAGETVNALAMRAGIEQSQLWRFLATGEQHRAMRLETADKLARAPGLTLKPIDQK